MNKDQLYIEHIKTAVGEIESFVVSMGLEDFAGNNMAKSAVVRQLEIIGEAARNLSNEFKDQHTDIKWSDIISMRNWLIHQYFEVDTKVVWRTVKEDLEVLKKL
jgi:uncharacterized protein with HEPN domain